MQRHILSSSCFSSSLTLFHLPSPSPNANTLPYPRHQIEVPTTCKNADPQGKLGAVDGHTENVIRGLKDCCE